MQLARLAGAWLNDPTPANWRAVLLLAQQAALKHTATSEFVARLERHELLQARAAECPSQRVLLGRDESNRLFLPRLRDQLFFRGRGSQFPPGVARPDLRKEVPVSISVKNQLPLGERRPSLKTGRQRHD